ncbi:MmgE/PrpD family protein [Verticiella sediminum]|uniref:MmgE/PrpD family protein n=1 Tax=Verticiella sediminum TaxID=1247510 RepID=A0A556AIG9_9BURK|nr:MmgE/PrpD family protein [Verticiella sediminum]TSH92666.1 MmgE/PrpD family protein [Verticiella sediminum]
MSQTRTTRPPQPTTAALAEFASRLTTRQLDDVERREAARHLVDTLGACVAGAGQPVWRSAAGVLRELDLVGAARPVPIPGTTERGDVLHAAYLMAVACHALELDDGNREGSIHPGTVVVPAALALGHRLDSDGDDLIAAVVAGYEVAIALAEVLHPHAARRGFQTTPVAGVIGAAAACGRLLGLAPAEMESALGIAASSSAGLFAYLAGGGNIKKLHPAHAAREGVFAALLAAEGGVQGPRGVAEGPAGVFQAFAGLAGGPPAEPRRNALAVVRSYLKPYPACRHIHPAIDALLALRGEHGIDPAQVASINVGTYEAAMPHAALGWDTLPIAQLSFPYVVAVALQYGAVALPHFSDETRARPEIAALAAKVSVHADPVCCAAYPAHGPADVTIVMADGTRHQRYVAEPLGSPDLALSDAQLLEKFSISVAGLPRAADAGRMAAGLLGGAAPGVRALVHELLA